ncbi:MAG: helix-turn-helix domain-containing protein [Chitinispirillaceae bacterium]
MNYLREYRKTVQNAVDYIEQNLTCPLDLRQIAGEVFYSPYHFHRLFRMVTGQTVKSYIRKRRISEAAIELVQTDKKMVELAFDYGFSSNEAFTRAFRRFFFLSPSDYRFFGTICGNLERIEIGETIEADIGHHLSAPRLVSLPGMRFIGLKRSGLNSNAENYRITYEFFQRMHEIRNKTNHNYYTISSSHFDSSGIEIMDFYVVCQTTSLSDVPHDMVGLEIAPRDYAFFTYKGNAENLTFPEGNAPVYDTIYNKLLPENRWAFREKDFCLQYTPSFRPVETEELQILIPVNVG